MAFFHGIRTSERETSIKSPASTTAGLPVIYGTAPVHLASDPAASNKPILCYTYAEAVAALGYCTDWKNYTLCEAIYSEFVLYSVAPVVFVNVLDPYKHKATVSNAETAVANKLATVADPVLLSTLVVKTAADGTALKAGTDYEAAYDDDGVLQITALDGGAMASASTVYLSYDKLDPSAVTSDDIIGGIGSDGSKKGLETLDQVFTMYRLVPGMILAPGWSDNPEVASVMKAKAGNIDGVFSAISLVDIPTDAVTNYTNAPAWKTNNNYTSEDQYVGWPMVKNGSKIYHMSTHLCGVCGQTDAADDDDVPWRSPSNKTLQATGLCLADGTDVGLDLTQANYLNGQGITTGLNFIGGWKLWGNRTAAYPSNTDVKDAFITSRRMMHWYAQRFILTYWANVDDIINKRFIETVVDSANIDLNGLTAAGKLLGGRMAFEAEFNPTTSLLDGSVTFHTYLGIGVPAEDIHDINEIDPSYLSGLFE